GEDETALFLDHRGTVTIKAKLIRFCRSDIVSLLVALGLIPPAIGAVATAEGQDSVSGTASAIWPEIADAAAGVEGQDKISGAASAAWPKVASTLPAAKAAPESSSAALKDSAKQLVFANPRPPEETAEEYYDRLRRLCDERYSRKTLRNYYSQIWGKGNPSALKVDSGAKIVASPQRPKPHRTTRDSNVPK